MRWENKKVAVVKDKQKRSADEESIEDIDDEEFENMIGNLFLLTQFVKLLIFVNRLYNISSISELSIYKSLICRL